MNWQDDGIEESGISFKMMHLFRKRLWPYVVRYRLLFLLSLALVLLSTLTALIVPWLLGYTIDHVLVPKETGLLIPFAIVLLGTDLLGTLATYLQSYTFALLGQRVLHDLRQDLLTQYQFYPLSEYHQTPVGRLVTRLVNDTSNLQDLFTSGLAIALGNASVVLGITLWLIFLHPVLGLVCISVFPVMILASRLFAGRIRDASHESRAALSKLNAFLAENITGMGIIQIFNKRETFRHRFEKVSHDYTRTQIKSLETFAYFQPTITILSSLSMSLLIWYGGFISLQGTISLGLLVAFMSYLHALYAPIRDITEKYNLFLSAMTSCERIFEFMDRSKELDIQSDISNISRLEMKGDVEFRDVWFRYLGTNVSSNALADNGNKEMFRETETVFKARNVSDFPKFHQDREEIPWVLKNINFSVRAGEKIGIVGYTGAGKTTLSLLLMRFYDVQKGKILIDGMNISSVKDKRFLRQAMGYIQQEPFLFSGTVEDNIFLWEKKSYRIFQALPDFVRRSFESGQLSLTKEVFEKGVNLSVGERQIISFMRAIVQDPSILILDEATAHMDVLTEHWIEQVSEEAFKGRTVFIIAHRLSTLKSVDRIIVLHHGELIETGTHQELLAKGGIYYKLYQIQSRKEELEHYS
jgi:ATP-binding cassette subfamily B protein